MPFFSLSDHNTFLYSLEENLYVYVQVTKCVHVCRTVICKGSVESGVEHFARAS